MVTLDKIVKPILEEFPKAHVENYDPSRSVYQVESLERQPVLDACTLYICSGSKTLSSAQLEAAEHMPQPLLLLRGSSVDSMLSLAKERLLLELRLQQETSELYRLLNTGSGLDALVRKAEVFLQRPVSILDASYSMMASSPMMKALSFGVEQNTEGDFLDVEEVESLRRLQIENKIYQYNSAFFVQTEDHPDTNWIFCAIRIQHVMSGYIAVCLPGDVESATEHELRLTNIISEICSVEMQKHDFFHRKTGLQYESFLIELLEGRYSDVNIIESRLRMLNRSLGKIFCLAVLYSTNPHNSDMFNTQQMSQLRKVYNNSMSVVYENNIVLLINQNAPIMLNQDFVQPLEDFARHNQLKVSMSQPFTDTLKIKIFYQQAVHTMELSAKITTDQRIFYSTEALPEYLFSKCSYAELETGIHYNIFQLRDYDTMFHTDLVETLRAFIQHDRNATTAAEALHIHRSTFFYRMKKIEEVIDASLTDGRLLFLYELSFKIWDYLETKV